MSWDNLYIYETTLTAESAEKLKPHYDRLDSFHGYTPVFEKKGFEFLYMITKSLTIQGAIEPIVFLTQPNGMFKVFPGISKFKFYLAAPEHCDRVDVPVLIVDMFDSLPLIEKFFTNVTKSNQKYYPKLSSTNKGNYKFGMEKMKTPYTSMELENKLYRYQEDWDEYFALASKRPSLVFMIDGKPALTCDGGLPYNTFYEAKTASEAYRKWMQWIGLLED